MCKSKEFRAQSCTVFHTGQSVTAAALFTGKNTSFPEAAVSSYWLQLVPLPHTLPAG